MTQTQQEHTTQQQDFTTLFEQSGLGRAIAGGMPGLDPSSLWLTHRITEAYFEQQEASVRASRRITEVAALSLMQSQIAASIVPIVTAQVTQQVMSRLGRDANERGGSSFGSGSGEEGEQYS